jgi:hypothetical protein
LATIATGGCFLATLGRVCERTGWRVHAWVPDDESIIICWWKTPQVNLTTRNNSKMNAKLSIVREFWSFLRVRKKWWLAPIVVVLLTLGLILVLTEGSALAPFIYSLF